MWDTRCDNRPKDGQKGKQVSEKLAVEFMIPYPPSGNHIWKHTQAGAHYLTPKAQLYYQTVAVEVMRQSAHRGLEGRLGVRCVIYPPDKRRRDMDNAWKVISDACTRARVWIDDNQIDQITLFRARDSQAKGMISMRVWVLEESVANQA